MALKRTSEDAKGSGSSAAAPIRPSQTTGQPIPEPASPRDVPEPLGDLPPESVGRNDGASPNRKERRSPIPSGPGEGGSRTNSSKGNSTPRALQRDSSLEFTSQG